MFSSFVAADSKVWASQPGCCRWPHRPRIPQCWGAELADCDPLSPLEVGSGLTPGRPGNICTLSGGGAERT